MTRLLKRLLRPALARYGWFRRWHGGHWRRLLPFEEESWPVVESTPTGDWPSR